MDELGNVSSLSAVSSGAATQVRLFKGQEEQLESVVNTLLEGTDQSAELVQAYAERGIGQRINVVA